MGLMTTCTEYLNIYDVNIIFILKLEHALLQHPWYEFTFITKLEQYFSRKKQNQEKPRDVRNA